MDRNALMQSHCFKNTSGFTLLELMVVIAIIGVLYTVAIGFTENPAIFREKSIRMQSYIEDQIKSARTDTMIGKGPRDATFGVKGVQKREVIVSGSLIQTVYYSGATSTGVESTLVFPFFEGDKNYTLKSISGRCTSGTSFTGNTATITYEQNQDVKITTLPVSCTGGGNSIRSITFTSKYQNYTADVSLDRISGIIKSSKPVNN